MKNKKANRVNINYVWDKMNVIGKKWHDFAIHGKEQEWFEHRNFVIFARLIIYKQSVLSKELMKQ